MKSGNECVRYVLSIISICGVIYGMKDFEPTPQELADFLYGQGDYKEQVLHQDFYEQSNGAYLDNDNGISHAPLLPVHAHYYPENLDNQLMCHEQPVFFGSNQLLEHHVVYKTCGAYRCPLIQMYPNNPGDCAWLFKTEADLDSHLAMTHFNVKYSHKDHKGNRQKICFLYRQKLMDFVRYYYPLPFVLPVDTANIELVRKNHQSLWRAIIKSIDAYEASCGQMIETE